MTGPSMLHELKRVLVRPPAAGFDVVVRAPGSKSLSNRALLLAAMREGTSELHGVLDADDTRHMIACLRALGVELEHDESTQRVSLRGHGPRLGHAARQGPADLHVGTAGTVARFLVAVLAAGGAPARIDGSPRMRERPMATLLDALTQRGAKIDYAGAPGALPIELREGGHFAGGEIVMARPTSSQFVSALAIAAVRAQAPTRIVLQQGSPAMPYITMTLDVLRAFGFDAQWERQGQALVVMPCSAALGEALTYQVEPDASSASYFLALAAIHKGTVSIPGLGRDSVQGDARFFEVLERFGARAQQDAHSTRVTGSGRLTGLELDMADMPDMALTAAIVAAHATGPTQIRGVGILRHHESDRISAGATELRKLGCSVEEYDDGFRIVAPEDGLARGVSIQTYDDHRMAMAFSLAGEVEILDPVCAAKTFPRYFEELAQLGMCHLEAHAGHDPAGDDPTQDKAADPAQDKAPGQSELRPTAIDAHGDGVGKLEGSVLTGIEAHAPGLFPGEHGRVQIEAHARNARPARAHVRVLQRLEDHPARREPPCVHHPEAEGSCTGCPLMALELSEQVALKRARIEACLGLTLDDFVEAPEALGYRHSVKRVVAGHRGALTLGSYVRGTHQVADMADCLVDHPAIVAALDELVREANVLEIEAYRAPNARRAAPSGDLRYVWAKTDGARVVLTLITGESTSRAARKLPALLELSDAVAWSVQGAASNRVRGDSAKALRGDPKLDITLLGQPRRVGPLDFLQPNPAVAQLAYEALLSSDGEAPATGGLAFDLYAGAGATTARLQHQFAEVIPCENFPDAARALGIDPMPAAEFVESRVNEHAKVDLVVANPPRAGLGARTCAALLALGSPRLHIMSCSPESLAKDIARLSANYEVLAVRAFDTLPQTAHVECVAWLRLRDTA